MGVGFFIGKAKHMWKQDVAEKRAIYIQFCFCFGLFLHLHERFKRNHSRFWVFKWSLKDC